MLLVLCLHDDEARLGKRELNLKNMDPHQALIARRVGASGRSTSAS